MKEKKKHSFNEKDMQFDNFQPLKDRA